MRRGPLRGQHGRRRPDSLRSLDRPRLALSTASVVAVLTLTAVSCDDDSSEVVLGEAGRADVVEVVDAPAAVVATAAATLTAVSDGTLAELLVEPGDDVSEGDIVAVIDSPQAERRLEQAEQALTAANQATAGGGIGGGGGLVGTQVATDAAATTAFDQAREAAEHVADEALRETLLAQVDAAQEQYETAAAAAQEAIRAVERGLSSLGDAVAAMGAAQQIQAQQGYDLAEATVDALTLRAPLDGVVQLGGVAAGTGETDVLGLLEGLAGGGDGGGAPAAESAPGLAPVPAAGSPVTAGTPVLTIVDVSELAMLAEVDETDVLLVEPGVEVEVELDAAVGARYPAMVTAVDLLPTPSARGGVAYGVHLDLGAGTWPDGRDAPPPRPGMSAVAHLRVAEAADTLAVPAAAVLRVDDADVVWVVRDGRANRTPVTLGVEGPELVEVVSGLEPGDQIVVRGADQVTEGQRLP